MCLSEGQEKFQCQPHGRQAEPVPHHVASQGMEGRGWGCGLQRLRWPTVPCLSLGTPGSQVWVGLFPSLFSVDLTRTVGDGSCSRWPRGVHKGIAPAVLNLGSEECVTDLLCGRFLSGLFGAGGPRTFSRPLLPPCGICGRGL